MESHSHMNLINSKTETTSSSERYFDFCHDSKSLMLDFHKLLFVHLIIIFSHLLSCVLF